MAGPWRAILITLAVLAALAVGADAGLRAIAEARLAASVQRALGLPGRPDIELQGFPFVLQVARGRIDHLTVELEDIAVEGLSFDRVTLDVDQLAFDRVELFRGPGTVSVGEGSGEAVVTQRALSTYLQEQGTPVSVRLQGPDIQVSTRISTGADTTTASAQGPVRVEGGRLVFSPDDVRVDGSLPVPAAALAFSVALPDLMPGLRYESVAVEDGTASIEARLAGARLDLA